MTTTLLLCDLNDTEVHTPRYRDLLDRREREQFEALRWLEARQRHLVSRAMLRLELARCLGCRPQEVAFAHGAQGKPRLAGTLRDWRFNLSHSHGRVVLALSRNAEVGVDIEYHGRRSRIRDLAAHYFSPLEREQLAALPEKQQRYRFFQLWTLKEARAKAGGESIWTTLGGTRFDLRDPHAPILHLDGAAASPAPIAYWHFALDDDYSLALMEIPDAEAHTASAPTAFRIVPGDTREPLSITPDVVGRHIPD